MKRGFLLLFLLTFSVCDIALMAQQSNTGCYSKLKREGQIAYDAGNYPKAIGLWESAKKCSDVPAGNNLQALINQRQFGAGQGLQAQQLNQAAALQAQQQQLAQLAQANQFNQQNAQQRAQYAAVVNAYPQ